MVDETLDTTPPAALKGSTHYQDLGNLKVLSIGHQSNTSTYPAFPISRSPSLDGDEPELPDPVPLTTSPETTCAAILLPSRTTGKSKTVMLSH